MNHIQENSIIYEWSDVLNKLVPSEITLKYLNSSQITHGITLQELWYILDEAWNELLKDPTTRNQNLSDFLFNYYQNPVWLINAAFSESDPNTINDRLSAIRLVSHVSPQKILDFGGGIGTVSRLCAISLPYTEVIDLVDITKFHNTVTQYLSSFSRIRILIEPDPPYDAIISTEVFEHLIDPIRAVYEINLLLRIGGAFAGSWSFAPGIKCHLPQNFHLKRLMPWIIRSLGFGFYGFERRGSTVYGFVKHSHATPNMLKIARFLGNLSRLPLPWDRLLLLLRGL